MTEASHQERVDWAATVAALGQGVVVLDADARIVAVNHAAEGLLGRAASELEGRRSEVTVEELHRAFGYHLCARRRTRGGAGRPRDGL
jgi:PAS domain S-box-containing protein